MENKLKAATIQELLSQLDDEWYDAVEGSYSAVPTWGPETRTVAEQIGLSCAEGDIVSWDTRDCDESNHVYLRRDWHPGCKPKHRFSVLTHSQWLAFLDAA